jgi:3'(2'), 5'-bisphosphate nucleotidase
MNDLALLDLAFDLARRAGEVILAVRARGFETFRKDDASPVTEADHAAEALIAAALREATPDIPVVAEEEIAGGHDPETRDLFWLVDPLDGTREFAGGGADFAVCIGLVRGLRPVLGVIGEPVRGECYGGIVGAGAWKATPAGRQPIQARRPPAQGLTVVTSRRSHDDRRLESLLAGRTVAQTQRMGSALKFCWIADGRADLYPRFGTTMEWDTAAGQALVEAAGGSVRDVPSGSVLGYGKPGWENPSFYGIGNWGADAATLAPAAQAAGSPAAGSPAAGCQAAGCEAAG